MFFINRGFVEVVLCKFQPLTWKCTFYTPEDFHHSHYTIVQINIDWLLNSILNSILIEY